MTASTADVPRSTTRHLGDPFAGWAPLAAAGWTLLHVVSKVGFAISWRRGVTGRPEVPVSHYASAVFAGYYTVWAVLIALAALGYQARLSRVGRRRAG